jgi:outer membrane biosynthesis protein TonB
MMSKKIFLALSLLVVAAMVLTACAPATPEPTEAPPPEPEATEAPPEPTEAPPEPEPTEEPEPEPEPTEEVMEETRGVLRYNTGLAYGGLENLNFVDPNRF